MILITGATGHFGKATIDFLLAKGVSAGSIGALVRDQSKAVDLINKGISARFGDYNDHASLVAAFTGIDKVLLISRSDIENRFQQQKNVVSAAKDAGVKHLLYTSFTRKSETDSSPIAFVASRTLTQKISLKPAVLLIQF